MTRPTWTGMDEPESTPKNFDELTADYQRNHFKRLWRHFMTDSTTHAVRMQLLDRISAELDRAYEKHGSEQWGRHEFYAILKEEVDELWDAIKSDAPQPTLIKEAVQVAAMVFRYYETGDKYREPICL